jgi:hypothetical protein
VVVYVSSAGYSQLPWGEIGRDPGRWVGVAVVGVLALAGLLGVSLAVLTLGGKLQGRPLDAETASAGEEPVVLYLRSFSLDQTGEENWSQEASSLVGGARAVFAGTVEERMLRPLKVFGRVLAIGRPGERLPTRGAERVYVGDRDWQRTVLDLMRRASLVVIAPDTSPGIRWEMESAFKTVPAESLVLILPETTKVEEEVSTICTRMGVHPPAEVSGAFALGFTEDGRTEVLVRRPANGPAIVEGLGFALMKRRGLQRLLRREAWGRVVSGLSLIGLFVMVPAALLSLHGSLIAVAASFGLLLLAASAVDRRPWMASSSAVGLSLLGFSLLDPAPPAPFVLAGSLVFLATVVAAFIEGTFTPSGRLVREVRRAQSSGGREPRARLESAVGARSRRLISRRVRPRRRM